MCGAFALACPTVGTAQSSWTRRRPGWLIGLGGALAAAALAVAGTLLYLKLHEDELVFHTAISHARTHGRLPPGGERVVIHGPGDTELAAVILRPDAAHDSTFWILLLHGNADSAFSSEQLRHCESLRELGFSVLSFDYRGFGLSPGVASEAHMDQDAEAALQALIERGISPAHIVLWGHSLGSGPAVVLASEHPVAALLLFGAFTSIPDAAQDTYPYLPVKWITGVRFASIDLIARVHVPVLVVHSATDTVIPLHHAQRLFDAANEPKRLLVLNGVYSDGFGCHVAALYDHGELLGPALSAVMGQRLSLTGTPAAQ